MATLPDDAQLSGKAKAILAEIDQAFGLVPDRFSIEFARRID
jgi:hypothetical protein